MEGEDDRDATVGAEEESALRAEARRYLGFVDQAVADWSRAAAPPQTPQTAAPRR